MGNVGMEPGFWGSDGKCRLGFARQDERAIILVSNGNCCTIRQKSILSGKTLIRTRKLTESFHDNIRISVIV